MAKWWNKKTRMVVLVVIGVASALFVGLLTYYSIPMRAEQKELYSAQNMQTVRYTETSDAIVLAPLTTAKKGLLLYPGGRVEARAYAYKMALVAQSDIVIVIAKSPLHLAPLDWHSPSFYTGLVPSVTEWYVGGHSVGGIRACQVAGEGAQFKGLVLLAAYCADNITGAGMPVLSIAGDQDKHTTAEDIDKHKHLLPPTTDYQTIKGLNHAGFGDYGVQSGDGDMTISDAEARNSITQLVTTFMGTAKKVGGQSGAQ